MLLSTEFVYPKSQMRMDGEESGLSKISPPFLNGVASRDDLVAPASSKVLNDVVGSNDKSLMEHHSGHVGLWPVHWDSILLLHIEIYCFRVEPG
jgi:poly(3-hydroxyalkanoate) synthetase